MAASTYENQNLALARSRTDWGAIWAGVFTFLAIWTVFGLLGMAIFASSASPNAARPVSGMNWGMSVWAIVLTAIAMWYAGVETGRLAGIASRRDGVLHGMAMFGLSMAAVLVIIALASTGTTTGADVSAHSPYFLNAVSTLGWAGFVATFLGWLAAMWGASSGIKRRAGADTTVEPIRRAA
jgi:hypothetical protein